MADDVSVKIGADIAEMKSKMAELHSAMTSSFKGIESTAQQLNGTLGRLDSVIKTTLASLAGFISLNTAKAIVETASSFEQLEIKLRAVMGSAEAGDRAFAWIKQFAVDTPNSVKDTAAAFMMLKNFGLDPMDGTLKKLSDSASKYTSGADGLARVTLAMGQAWGRGKLQGQDILQMIDAGIPVYDLMGKTLHKTTAEIQEMSEKGTMTRKEMRAFIDTLGSDAAGMAAAKMNSYAGAMSNLGDAFENSVDKWRKEGGFDWITKSVLEFTSYLPSLMDSASMIFSSIGESVKQLYTVVTDALSTITQAIKSAFGVDSEPMSAMQLFENMLKVVAVAFIGFRIGLEVMVESGKTLLSMIVSAIVNFSDVAEKAFHLDWEGAKAAWKKGTEENISIFQSGMDRLVTISQKGRDDIDKAIMGSAVTAAPVAGTAVDTSGDAAASATKTKISLLEKWKAEIEKMRIDDAKENGALHELEKSEEIKFWDEKLRIAGKGTKEYIAVTKLRADASRNMSKEELAGAIEVAQHQIDMKKGDFATEQTFSAQILALKKFYYGESSREYKSALLADELRLQQHVLTEGKAYEGLINFRAELLKMQQSLESENANFLLTTGQINAKEKASLDRNTIDELYKTEHQKLEIIASGNIDRKEDHQKTLQEMVKLEKQYALDVNKNDHDMILANKSMWDELLSPIKNAVEKSVTGMIMGTTSLKDAMKNLTQSILGEFVSLGVKKLVNWTATEAALLGVKKTSTAGQLALEQSASAASKGVHAADAVTKITADAPVAGAGVSAQTAPYLGWGAIAMGAAAMAAVLAMTGSIKSSAGGDWQVGSDRLNLVHKDETILPAGIAGGLRNMIANGGGAGSPTTNNNMNIVVNSGGNPDEVKRAAGDGIRAAMSAINGGRRYG